MAKSVTEVLYGMLNWNDTHPEGDPLHAPDLNIALAMMKDVDPEITDELDKETRAFNGRYYDEAVEANKKADSYEEFAAIMDPLYEQYKADIAEYEKEKVEEAAEGDTGFTHPLG